MSKEFVYLGEEANATVSLYTLSNRLSYTTEINIDSFRAYITCGYNSRSKMRWIKIQDYNGTPVLTQTFMKDKKRCELNFNGNLNNLDYYVTLRKKDIYVDLESDYDYVDWADDFYLSVVGISQETRDILENNFITLKVGS